MLETRPIKEIIDDAMSARIHKAKLAWSLLFYHTSRIAI